MANWCMFTGRSVSDYLNLSIYEIEAFAEEAKKLRNRKGGTGSL